jgi:hypothetical protein
MSTRKTVSTISNPAPGNLSLRSSSTATDEDINLPKRPWNANVKAYSKAEPHIPWYKRQSRTPVWTETSPTEKGKQDYERMSHSFSNNSPSEAAANLRKLKSSKNDNSSKPIMLGDIRGSMLFRQISIDKESGMFHDWSNQSQRDNSPPTSRNSVGFPSNSNSKNSPKDNKNTNPHTRRNSTLEESKRESYDESHITSSHDIVVDISHVYKPDSPRKSLTSVFKKQPAPKNNTAARTISPIRYEHENKFGKLHRQQEEIKRQEEAKKQEEARKIEELKRQEELKALEDFNLQMEMKRLEDAKKQEEGSVEGPSKPKLKRRKSFRDSLLDIFVRPISRAASRAPSRAASRPGTPEIEAPNADDVIIPVSNRIANLIFFMLY